MTWNTQRPVDEVRVTTRAGSWDEAKMTLFQHITKNYHLSLTKADPYYVAHSEAQIAFAVALQESWRLTEVLDRATQSVDDVLKVYRAELEARESRKAAAMNRALFALAVVQRPSRASRNS